MVEVEARERDCHKERPGLADDPAESANCRYVDGWRLEPPWPQQRCARYELRAMGQLVEHQRPARAR
jgi:hypothetical protein